MADEGAAADVRETFERVQRRLQLETAVARELAASAGAPVKVAKGACVSQEGDPVSALVLVCSGLMLSSRRLHDGSQQHLALLTPGEFVDGHGFVLGRASASTSALTTAELVSVSRGELTRIADRHPSLEAALRREQAISGRIAQEWMIGMGRRSAYVRVAHLLCEMSVRLAHAGMSGPDGLPFPLTQGDLADLVGLSVVHTNRVLQQLRREGRQRRPEDAAEAATRWADRSVERPPQDPGPGAPDAGGGVRSRLPVPRRPGLTVPRYFFHLEEPGGLDRDEIGAEFATPEAAYLDAYKAVLDISLEMLHARQDPTRRAFLVLDATGRQVMEIPFIEVLRPGSAPAPPSTRDQWVRSSVAAAMARGRELKAELRDSVADARTTVLRSRALLQEARGTPRDARAGGSFSSARGLGNSG